MCRHMHCACLPSTNHNHQITHTFAVSNILSSHSREIVTCTDQLGRQPQDKQLVRLIAKAPTIAAYAYHKLSGRMPSAPNQKLGYAENFLYMLDAGSAPDYKPNPRLARALEVG